MSSAPAADEQGQVHELRQRDKNDRRRARWVLSLAWVVLASVAAPVAAAPGSLDRAEAPGSLDRAEAVSELELWYFYREECPHCASAEVWLERLEREQPALAVTKVEVNRTTSGRALLAQMARDRGERPAAVPVFIVGDRVWIGFHPSIAAQIEAEVASRLVGEDAPAPRRTLELGPLGSIDIDAQPLAVTTLIIAIIDGFNPCSLWVLTVLLAMILNSGSRARIAAVGFTFLLVTASIYGAFIAGLFAALSFAGHLGWIQVPVALLALAFGAINVKDFFAYKKGLSFTIPERFKPSIYRGGRAVRKERPLALTLAITVGLAGGVAIVELPCTAGFPMIWTALLSEAGVSSAGFAALLALYLSAYLSVEIALLLVALVTLRATRMQERHGRVLKLFGGMVMIALAAVLLVHPPIMEQLAGSVLVIAGAIAASLLVLLVERRWRPTRPPGRRSPRGPRPPGHVTAGERPDRS